VTDNSTTTIAAATMVADPRSSRRFDRRHPGRRDVQHGQQIRPGNDRRDDESAVPVQLHNGAAGRDPTGRRNSRSLVTTRGQPGRLAGRVDTANLHRHRCDAGQAQHEYRNQNGDTERRFHRGQTGIVG
jgi:hypothetical protein